MSESAKNMITILQGRPSVRTADGTGRQMRAMVLATGDINTLGPTEPTPDMAAQHAAILEHPSSFKF